jgi:hypothetical protein
MPEELSTVKELLFGEMAVRAGLVTQAQVDECLEIQRKYRETGQDTPRLGEILAGKNYLYIDQVRAILRGEFSHPGKLFGEMAIQMGFCKHGHVNECLRVQAEMEKAQGALRPRIGVILAEKGHLGEHQLRAVLEGQGKTEEALKAAEKSGAHEVIAHSADRVEESVARTAIEIDKALAEPAEEVDTAAPAAAAARPKIVPSMVIGGFRVEQVLGEDSFGTVYRAKSEPDGTAAALKVLDLTRSRDPKFKERFVEEARRGATLRHPNIKRILLAGQDKGYLFYATEFFEGKSLRRTLEARGRMTLVEATVIVRQAASALQYAHASGVIHGDLRPVNVLIGPDGTVKVANLGLAKDSIDNMALLTASGEKMPFYMAPELGVRGRHFDERADIYSLGAIYYHCVTGRPPFEGRSPLEVLMRITQEDFAPPRRLAADLPEGVDRLITKMLASEPIQRVQSMAEVIAELDRISGHGSAIPAAAPVLGYSLEEALPEGMEVETGSPLFGDAPPAKGSGAKHSPMGVEGAQGQGGRFDPSIDAAIDAMVAQSAARQAAGFAGSEQPKVAGSGQGITFEQPKSGGGIGAESESAGGGTAPRDGGRRGAGRTAERGSRRRGREDREEIRPARQRSSVNPIIIVVIAVCVVGLLIIAFFAIQKSSEDEESKKANEKGSNQRKKEGPKTGSDPYQQPDRTKDAPKAGVYAPQPEKAPVVNREPPRQQKKYKWENGYWYDREEPEPIRNASGMVKDKLMEEAEKWRVEAPPGGGE